MGSKTAQIVSCSLRLSIPEVWQGKVVKQVGLSRETQGPRCGSTGAFRPQEFASMFTINRLAWVQTTTYT